MVLLVNGVFPFLVFPTLFLFAGPGLSSSDDKQISLTCIVHACDCYIIFQLALTLRLLEVPMDSSGLSLSVLMICRKQCGQGTNIWKVRLNHWWLLSFSCFLENAGINYSSGSQSILTLPSSTYPLGPGSSVTLTTTPSISLLFPHSFSPRTP